MAKAISTRGDDATVPRMRLLLAASALLLTLSLLPPPAAAGACSGPWVGSSGCSFACDGLTLAVSGDAENPTGAPASVTVVAQCGLINPDGTYSPLYGISCSAGGTTPVSCSNAGINLLPGAGLVGLCTVSGNDFGNFACSSV
jgi:hypothetical protein